MSCNNSSTTLSDRCPEGVTSTLCISYQGNAFDCLSVCTGDSLNSVLNSMNSNLCSVVTAIDMTGITTTCPTFTTLFGTKSKNVLNYITTLIQGECNLQAEIDAITSQLATFNPNITLDYKCCLPGCITSSTNTLTQSLQNIIDCNCSQATTIATLQTLVNSFDSRISALEAQMGSVGTGNSNVQSQLTSLTNTSISNSGNITALQGSVSNLCSGNPC